MCYIMDIYRIHLLQILNLSLHIIFEENLEPRLVSAQLDLVLGAESFGELKEISKSKVLDAVGDDQSVIRLPNS